MHGKFIQATPRHSNVSEGAETTAPLTNIARVERDEDGKPIEARRLKTFNRSETHPELNGVFGKFLEDGTPYVSPSQVRKVMTCGADWRFSYLDNRPRMSSVPMEFGSNNHDVLQEAMDAILAGSPHPTAVLTEKAEKAAMARFTDPGILATLRDPEEAKPAELAAKAKECMEAAMNWFNEQGLTPLATEGQTIYRVQVPHPYTLEEVVTAILGYYDLYAKTAAGRHLLLDYKHTASAPNRDLQAMQEAHGFTYNEAKNNKDEAKNIYTPDRGHFHALLTYADAMQAKGIPVDEVWAVYVTKAVNPRVIPVKMNVTEEMLAWARVVSKAAMKKILSRDLDPDPFSASWMCRTCDHREICPGSALIVEERHTVRREPGGV